MSCEVKRPIDKKYGVNATEHFNRAIPFDVSGISLYAGRVYRNWKVELD